MAKDIGLDSILQELGAFGKYNIVNYAILLFPVFLAGMYGSIYIFEAPDIDYRYVIFYILFINSLMLIHIILRLSHITVLISPSR